ncbi:prenyltransferase [Corynebacterium capitovis DSM 44611]|uniref:prenyltransferase n=1 Tax=Corynebacterium capitovis TaxID=131081 RepID=UPI0003714CDE|nr:prenyltransferase [Corynebacterium capitovis]WKD57966.1 prenyltransferase [Corynebacterium capitovis DSM 44611]
MIRSILAASRPLSWVNTAVPFALGYLLATRSWDWRLVLGFVFFLVPYNIAMYGINDVFDYESDIRNPRKGGVEGAVLPKSMHRPLLIASAVTTLPFIIALLFCGTSVSAAWLALSLFAVYAYSAPPFRFKEIPVLDSVTSSTHFVTPALIGATLTTHHVDPRFAFAAVAFFLWGMASHALGAVQDVNADREGGLTSIATQFGARLTTFFAAALYVLAALLAVGLPFSGWLVSLLGLGYAANTIRFAGVRDETSETVNRAWKVFLWLNYITGGVVTMSVLFALFGP